MKALCSFLPLAHPVHVAVHGDNAPEAGQVQLGILSHKKKYSELLVSRVLVRMN